MLLPLLLMTGCGNLINPQPDQPTEGEKHEVRQLVLSTRQQEIKAKQNAFTIDLLRQARQSGEANVFLSPLSVQMVCQMLANGASEETLTEIRTALGLDGYTMQELNDYYQLLTERLPYQDTGTLLKIANALWLDEGFDVKPSFVETNRHYLHANVEVLELSDGQNAGVINHWADTATNGLIREVVQPSMFSDMLRMVVGNALYFKSTWQQKFDKSNTVNEPFYCEGADEVSMPFMHQQATFQAALLPEDGVKILRMPYSGDGYSMDVVLPTQGTVSEVLSSLTADKLASMQASMRTYDVDLRMPRFKQKYYRMLNDDMQALGMERIFTPAAQLDGITESEQLFLSQLFQYTYVQVDEEGTEAAAVTIGTVGCTSVGETYPYMAFHANRPFIYLIRECRYGTILFMGVFGRPEE